MSNFTAILVAFSLFTLGQTFAWFQLFSQHVWPWWQGKALLAIPIFGLPAGAFFYYGVQIAYSVMGEAWGPRMMIFAASYVSFPLLAYFLMGEPIFTIKTILCIILSMTILAVQIWL
jgi:hypothetical protein